LLKQKDKVSRKVVSTFLDKESNKEVLKIMKKLEEIHLD